MHLWYYQAALEYVLILLYCTNGKLVIRRAMNLANAKGQESFKVVIFKGSGVFCRAPRLKGIAAELKLTKDSHRV